LCGCLCVGGLGVWGGGGGGGGVGWGGGGGGFRAHLQRGGSGLGFESPVLRYVMAMLRGQGPDGIMVSHAFVVRSSVLRYCCVRALYCEGTVWLYLAGVTLTL